MIANLQALRGIAALMVVVIHLQTILLPVLPKRFFDGALQAGVDIFFVISGFIMVYVTERRPETGRSFMLGRLIRIVPVYWLFTSVFLAAALVLGWQGPPSELIARYFPSLAFLPSGEAPQYMPLLYVGWTLNLEMYFYLLFAIGLATGLGRGSRLALVTALIAVPVVTAQFSSGESIWKFYATPMVFEFVLGMLLAHFRRLLERLPALAGLAMLAVGVAWLIANPAEMPNFPWLARYAMPAGLLVAGAIVAENRGWRIDARPVMVFGAASYSLYISHPLTVSVFNNIQERVPALQSPSAAVATAAVALAASVIFAVIVHYVFEKPVGAWLKARLHVPRSVIQPDIHG